MTAGLRGRSALEGRRTGNIELSFMFVVVNMYAGGHCDTGGGGEGGAINPTDVTGDENDDTLLYQRGPTARQKSHCVCSRRRVKWRSSHTPATTPQHCSETRAAVSIKLGHRQQARSEKIDIIMFASIVL